MHTGINGYCNICGKRHQCNVKQIDGQIHAYGHRRHLVVAQIQYRHYRKKYIVYGNSRYCHDPSAERNQETQRQSHQPRNFHNRKPQLVFQRKNGENGGRDQYCKL